MKYIRRISNCPNELQLIKSDKRAWRQDYRWETPTQHEGGSVRLQFDRESVGFRSSEISLFSIFIGNFPLEKFVPFCWSNFNWSNSKDKRGILSFSSRFLSEYSIKIIQTDVMVWIFLCNRCRKYKIFIYDV